VVSVFEVSRVQRSLKAGRAGLAGIFSGVLRSRRS